MVPGILADNAYTGSFNRSGLNSGDLAIAAAACHNLASIQRLENRTDPRQVSHRTISSAAKQQLREND